MDFPDPDEEFEMMYADELEVMRELEGKGVSTAVCCSVNGLAVLLTRFCIVSDECPPIGRDACPSSKRSLDFSSPKAPPSTGPAVQVMDGVGLQLPEVRVVLDLF
jgi:hypothetical protein